MAQGVPPFHYESDPSGEGLTALASLGVCLDPIAVTGLGRAVGHHVQAAGEQGWLDRQMVVAGPMLNLAGADRLRRGRERALPSATAMSDWLTRFHDSGEEAKREAGRAFVQTLNAALMGLQAVNRELIAFPRKHRRETVAAIDADAMLVAPHKRQALYCYKKIKAYQPLVALYARLRRDVWWAEQGIIPHSEFRDGNAPAGSAKLRVLRHALAGLPDGVEMARPRADTAGYGQELPR